MAKEQHPDLKSNIDESDPLSQSWIPRDWGEASEAFDHIKAYVSQNNLFNINEAETRLTIIDRMLHEVLGWRYGQIKPEERLEADGTGYIDYVIRNGDYTIVVEAKRYGKSFPSPTKRKKLRLFGSALGTREIAEAINQAIGYARDKKADVAIVTNGDCWIYFSMKNLQDNSYAYLLFPFGDSSHPEELFNTFSVVAVDIGSLEEISNLPPSADNRLIATLTKLDGRLDRNSLADHITPALDKALYADALLSNIDSLDRCYVRTEQRTKYDNQLEMHLFETRLDMSEASERLKRDSENNQLQKLVKQGTSKISPPLTLVIGPVGAGKSTFLKHFELVSGRSVLDSKQTHWIYIDFKQMGKSKDPKKFIYSQLRDYLDKEHPNTPTDYRNLVEPAYKDKIDALARGPLYLLYLNSKEIFNQKITEVIMKEYEEIEPYVNRLLLYLSSQKLCIIILDNVDLYEDEQLETKVFAEGLALSAKVKTNVIVSMRDTTYAHHRHESTFNAYELRALWLEPPDLKSVITRRLTYSKLILENEEGSFQLGRIKVKISDLGNFFDTVQRSVLDGNAGHFIESVADGNVRKGLTLITNFLTSGHVEANRAIEKYLKGERGYIFPFQEIFKGTMLRDWRHFREDRAECVNIFDARLGVDSLKLLRLFLLRELAFRAKQESTIEVPVKECIKIFSQSGASEIHVLSSLKFLQKNYLIKSISTASLNLDSVIAITRSGGYFAKILCCEFAYVEECMFDTAIGDNVVWNKLKHLTQDIENAEDRRIHRSELRRERMHVFMDYLTTLEDYMLVPLKNYSHLYCISEIKGRVFDTADYIVNASRKYHGQ